MLEKSTDIQIIEKRLKACFTAKLSLLLRKTEWGFLHLLEKDTQYRPDSNFGDLNLTRLTTPVSRKKRGSKQGKGKKVKGKREKTYASYPLLPFDFCLLPCF